jgi:hypothetical protein
VEIDRTGACLLGMEVDLPELTQGIRLDEMALVAYRQVLPASFWVFPHEPQQNMVIIQKIIAKE